MKLGYSQKAEVEKDVLKGVLSLDKTNDMGSVKFNEICTWLSLNPTDIVRKHSVGFRAYEEFKQNGCLDSSLSIILSPRTNSLNKKQIIHFLANFNQDEILKVHRKAVILSKKMNTN